MLSASLMGFLGYFDLSAVNRTGTLVYECHLVWVSDQRKYTYRAVVFSMTYILPMVLTGFSYYKIHVVVRDSLNRVNSLLTEAMLRSRSRKLHQMNITLTVMYTTFALLTLPLQTWFCVRDFDFLTEIDIVEAKEYLVIVVDACFLLFYTQILSNPFVLLYVGDEYRKELRYIRICCFAVIPRVRRWSRKIEGSFGRLYSRQPSCLLSTSPRPRDSRASRRTSSA